MATPATPQYMLLQTDVTFRDVFKRWGDSHISWFKPRLSAQVTVVDEKVQIAGQSIDDVTAQITTYEAARKQADSDGLFARLSFRLKSWFSPMPRLKAVVDYHNARQEYQKITATFAQAIRDEQAKDKAMQDYALACARLQKLIPERFISKKRRGILTHYINQIKQATLKESDPVEQQNARVAVEQKNIFSDCKSWKEINDRYNTLHRDEAVELIRRLRVIYQKNKITIPERYHQELRAINDYKMRIVKAKQHFRLLLMRLPPQRVKISQFEVEVINQHSSLRDCKSQALRYYAALKKAQAYDALLGFEDTSAGDRLQVIVEDLQKVYALLFKALDKREQAVEVKQDARIRFIEAGGIVYYLSQRQALLASHCAGLINIVNSAKTDLQRMRFRQKDDFMQFKHWVNQRITHYREAFKSRITVHPDLPELKQFFGRKRLTSKNNALLADIKNTGLSLIKKATRKLVDQVMKPSDEEFSRLYMLHDKQIRDAQEKERILNNEREAIVNYYSHEFQHGFNTSTAYICQGVVCSQGFEDAEDNLDKDDLDILKEREHNLIQLWIDTFEVYLEHLRRIQQLVYKTVLRMKPGALALLETGTDDIIRRNRDVYVQELLYQVSKKYLLLCEEAGIKSKLEELKSRWREVKYLHSDKNIGADANLKKLTDVYFGYFVNMPTDDELINFHGRYYWERLNQLYSLLDLGIEAYENQHDNAFLSSPRLRQMNQIPEFEIQNLPTELAINATTVSKEMALVSKKQKSVTINVQMSDLEEVITMSLYEPTEFASLQSRIQQTLNELKEGQSDIYALRRLRACQKNIVRLREETKKIWLSIEQIQESEKQALQREDQEKQKRLTTEHEVAALFVKYQSNKITKEAYDHAMSQLIQTFTYKQEQTTNVGQATVEQTTAAQVVTHGVFKNTPKDTKTPAEVTHGAENAEAEEALYEKHM